ncbi:MAG: glycoside hydrolase family 5 protein, partial [Oscillospiraceae bacterium]|nr:glycoside hydrolase family 5 protein [Oscillospiraceae bacterium]
MIKKRIFSFLTATVMTVSSVPFLASVIYSNTASTQAYAEGEFSIPELNIESRNVPDLESFKFAADMKLGWNLGNTLDAIDDDGYNSNKLDIEGSWCSVKTTKEMIDSIKKSGFQTIRIPVSWHNHIDENNNIDKEWLDRVQEVVDYAVANDMHIILNIHHDNDLKDGKVLGFYPEKQYLEQSLKYVEDIWTQVADRFKDYDEHLVFESLNEPRLIGSVYEWNFNANAQECIEAQECINEMNQKFVDVVRS